MPNEDRMNWDDVDLPSETITEEDITGAEAMGRVPPGRYLCTCIESNPVSRKAEGYNYIAASLKWKVDKAYEVRGEQIPEDKQDRHWRPKNRC